MVRPSPCQARDGPRWHPPHPWSRDTLDRMGEVTDTGPAGAACTVANGSRRALAVNLSCALLLARYRRHSGSLTETAFLSARNDTLTDIAVIAAGLVTVYALSAWPDLAVGFGIAAMNADAAREV
jgi:hypothetical protein